MGWKYKLAEGFIHHKNYFEKGMSLTYWIKGFVTLWIMGAVYIKLILKVEHISAWWIAIGTIAIILGAWLVGYLWDKWGIFIIENEWNNKRNKFVKEMRRKYNVK